MEIDDIDAMVVLTDAQIGDLDQLEQPDYPVIWGVIEEGHVLPFGKVVYIPTDGSA